MHSKGLNVLITRELEKKWKILSADNKHSHFLKNVKIISRKYMRDFNEDWQLPEKQKGYRRSLRDETKIPARNCYESFCGL